MAAPPDPKPVLFQCWRRLLFLHWEIAPETVAATLPEGLVPHLREGRAYLGIVPFLMRNIRLRGFPCVPWISNFLELNVRTYVLGPGGVPGVWFYSLDTDRRLARMLARAWFHLPYFDARMEAFAEVNGFLDFRALRHGQAHEARYRYRARSEFQASGAGSLEEFLLERYDLFSWNERRRCLQRGSVRHRPYQYAAAEFPEWNAEPFRWNGLPMPDAPPVHACVARDVEVSIFGIAPELPSGMVLAPAPFRA